MGVGSKHALGRAEAGDDTERSAKQRRDRQRDRFRDPVDDNGRHDRGQHVGVGRQGREGKEVDSGGGERARKKTQQSTGCAAAVLVARCFG